MDACLHHTASIIQLQRKLNVARVLRAIDKPHGPSATASRWCVQIHAVEGVEEICPELNPYPFSNREVLLHTQIHGPKTWTTHRSLSRATSELLKARRCIRGIVEPLVADVL